MGRGDVVVLAADAVPLAPPTPLTMTVVGTVELGVVEAGTAVEPLALRMTGFGSGTMTVCLICWMTEEASVWGEAIFCWRITSFGEADEIGSDETTAVGTTTPPPLEPPPPPLATTTVEGRVMPQPPPPWPLATPPTMIFAGGAPAAKGSEAGRFRGLPPLTTIVLGWWTPLAKPLEVAPF